MDDAIPNAVEWNPPTAMPQPEKHYSTRVPNVGDMRAIRAEGVEEYEVPFKLAERCILLNGAPIGEKALNDMDCTLFEKLMREVNETKKS